MYIYVQAQDGTPLMPTKRAGKVRRMLRDGKAVIVSHTPFAIRLTYETTHFVQPVSLGIDTGSSYIGLSATTAHKEIYASEIELRKDMVENLSTRREARRTRRGKRSMRYRAPRFNNRRASKKEGWLTPSVRQKAECHVNAVKHVCFILPVKTITVEVAQFDTQWIKDPGLTGTDYQHGEQFGFWNVREYVLWRDGHECQYCHDKSKDKILNVHHIESRKTGGDSPGNLVTLCDTCHDGYHKGKIELKLRRMPSLRDAAAMNVMRWAVYDRLKALLNVPIKLTYGYVTKHTRIEAGIDKSHVNDARCISGNPATTPSDTVLRFRKLRRHNRKVMRSNLLPGRRWKHNQAPREVKGFRLFDIIVHNGQLAYVHGRRTSGYFVIKAFDGKIISNSLSYKKLLLKQRSNAFMFYQEKRLGPIPPTIQIVGFLGRLS